MESAKINRINALAQKAKREGLTLEEKEEQRKLRAEYLIQFRQNMKRQIESIVYVDEEGREIVLKKKIQAIRIQPME